MAGRFVDVELDAIPRALRAQYDYIQDDLLRIIREETARGKQIAQALAQAQDLVGVGDPRHYIASFEVVNTPNGAHLGNSAPYAGALEFGTDPYFVPTGVVRKIAEWAEVKLGLPPKRAYAVALSVKDRIEAVGQYPHHILGQATEEIVRNIRRRLRVYARRHRAGQTRAAIRFRTHYGGGSRRRSVEV